MMGGNCRWRTRTRKRCALLTLVVFAVTACHLCFREHLSQTTWFRKYWGREMEILGDSDLLWRERADRESDTRGLGPVWRRLQGEGQENYVNKRIGRKTKSMSERKAWLAYQVEKDAKLLDTTKVHGLLKYYENMVAYVKEFRKKGDSTPLPLVRPKGKKRMVTLPIVVIIGAQVRNKGYGANELSLSFSDKSRRRALQNTAVSTESIISFEV
ncbi:unnamed protein product [Discosporangium mesarthrocarpum]